MTACHNEPMEEIIAHLIEEHLRQTHNFEEAVRSAMVELRGIFALSIACASAMFFIVPRRTVVVSEELVKKAEEEESGML